MPRSCGVSIGRGGGVAGAFARSGLCSTGKVVPGTSVAIRWLVHMPTGHLFNKHISGYYEVLAAVLYFVCTPSFKFFPIRTLLIFFPRTSGTWYLNLAEGRIAASSLPSSTSLLAVLCLLTESLLPAYSLLTLCVLLGYSPSYSPAYRAYSLVTAKLPCAAY